MAMENIHSDSADTRHFGVRIPANVHKDFMSELRLADRTAKEQVLEWMKEFVRVQRSKRNRVRR